MNNFELIFESKKLKKLKIKKDKKFNYSRTQKKNSMFSFERAFLILAAPTSVPVCGWGWYCYDERFQANGCIGRS